MKRMDLIINSIRFINADTMHPELYINDTIQAEYITVEGAKEAALEYNTCKIREELDIVANENG